MRKRLWAGVTVVSLETLLMDEEIVDLVCAAREATLFASWRPPRLPGALFVSTAALAASQQLQKKNQFLIGEA